MVLVLHLRPLFFRLLNISTRIELVLDLGLGFPQQLEKGNYNLISIFVYWYATWYQHCWFIDTFDTKRYLIRMIIIEMIFKWRLRDWMVTIMKFLHLRYVFCKWRNEIISIYENESIQCSKKQLRHPVRRWVVIATIPNQSENQKTC